MLIDITWTLTKDTEELKAPELIGHHGTHFDVMEKEFPLEYTKREGVIFDVSAVKDREIGLSDIDFNKVKEDMFIAFYSGFIEEEPYGTKKYFSGHPELSHELIDALVEKGVSIIGLDFAGIRRGKEHIPKDRFCAERGVFVVENLCNLKTVLKNGENFTAHTYPMNYVGITGLPCRVIVEV